MKKEFYCDIIIKIIITVIMAIITVTTGITKDRTRVTDVVAIIKIAAGTLDRSVIQGITRMTGTTTGTTGIITEMTAVVITVETGITEAGITAITSQRMEEVLARTVVVETGITVEAEEITEAAHQCQWIL